jgi:hypothetical protein
MKHLTILVFVALALSAAPTARAATLIVTNIADSGPASLRAAVVNAADGDTIDATGVSGTILLTSGELLATNSLTIVGPGQDILSVNGNASSRVFRIGSNAVVAIAGFTITNGLANDGGGIFNEGTLVVESTRFGGNIAERGGGIHSAGSLVISNCAFLDNSVEHSGGGIYGIGPVSLLNCTLNDNDAGVAGGSVANFGALTVSDCTIDGNESGSGGGIYNESGSVTVSNTSFIRNSAEWGGGIFNNGDSGTATLTVKHSILRDNSAVTDGGGIFNGFLLGSGSNATLHIDNSTLSRNSASYGGGGAIANLGSAAVNNCTVNDNIASYGGGIGNFSGTLAVTNSTISGNTADFPSGVGTYVGGGIYNEGVLAVESSTISANTAITDSGGIWTSGTATINSSIIALNAAASNADVVGVFTGAFNFIGGDPLLGLLADNGGPTMTMALLPGSPCINAGDPAFAGPPDFDQRGPGFARVSGGRIDIGAFEVQETTTGDTDGDGVPDDVDQCPDTPSGDIVNSSGCSIGQLVPCEGPLSGGTWKNHGQYVKAVVAAARDFLNAGFITQRQRAQIVTEAAHSKCGSKKGNQ